VDGIGGQRQTCPEWCVRHRAMLVPTRSLHFQHLPGQFGILGKRLRCLPKGVEAVTCTYSRALDESAYGTTEWTEVQILDLIIIFHYGGCAQAANGTQELSSMYIALHTPLFS
jgi:hypothetical protein